MLQAKVTFFTISAEIIILISFDKESTQFVKISRIIVLSLVYFRVLYNMMFKQQQLTAISLIFMTLPNNIPYILKFIAHLTQVKETE